MIEFSWELRQVLSGLKKNLLAQQLTKFLRPHSNIWGNGKNNFNCLAEEILPLLPSPEQKFQFIAVCLGSYLLDPTKAPESVPLWIQQQVPVSEIIGIDATLDELLTWRWDRAAFPVLDNQDKNDTIYYALVANSTTNSHPLMPSWVSEVMSEDAQDAVTVAAELPHSSAAKTSFFFWPFINPKKPTHDRSLGLPVYLAFLSVVRNTSIPPIIATGELTLQGRLVPVQGVQHKCDKAHEKRYKRFIYPEDGSAIEKRRDFTPVGVNSLEEAEAEWGFSNTSGEQKREQQSSNAAPEGDKDGAARTQAYFEDIQLHILNALRKARNTIHIAVAWFTDSEIFDLLCLKQQAGVRVELVIVNDAINRKSPIQHERITELGGLFLMIGNKKKSSAIMHNKFCVIDGETVITGSYNWSKQAQENWENITIISGQADLAQQFLQEFSSILDHGEKASQGVDHGKIMQRLEALRHVVELDDDDDVSLQLNKLKRLIPENETIPEVKTIIDLVESGHHSEAVTKISEYVSIRKQVIIYVDPEIPELKLELKALEIQVGALENEKADLEKLLHTFQFRYHIELGDILQKIFKLRVERLEKQAAANPDKASEAEEARQDYESFKKSNEESQDQSIQEISNDQQEELKTLFRASSKMCHPDLVAEADKAEATKLFSRLNEANEKNDIEAVREIYEGLQNGHFSTMSATISDAQMLYKQVVRMRSKLKELSKSIVVLKATDTFEKVSGIDNWDTYFTEMKEQLKNELEKLKTDE
jgi:hypothetical protein